MPLMVITMVVLALVGSACASTVQTRLEDSGERIPTVAPLTAEEQAITEATAVPADPAPAPATESAAPEPTTAPNPALVVPERLSIQVLREVPHDPNNFTQGLVIHDGRMFESTGRFGPSTTRLLEIDRSTGATVQSVESNDVFGEGLALVGDQFVQLTYTEGIALIWDADTLEKIGEFRYEDSEGWGLCHDGDRLVMTDGGDRLHFRDPETFAPLGSVEIVLEGVPLARVNELECVGGTVWGNVFLTDMIVEIDPTTGAVITVVDGSALEQPRPFESNAVLNGIAYDELTATFWLTGKLWDSLYEVNFVPAS